MLIKILGAIDVIVGLIFLFGMGLGLPTKLILSMGMILLLKSSLGMLKDFGGWIDFLSGIVLMLSILFVIPTFILFILGILLIQKGIFSFI